MFKGKSLGREGSPQPGGWELPGHMRVGQGTCEKEKGGQSKAQMCPSWNQGQRGSGQHTWAMLPWAL